MLGPEYVRDAAGMLVLDEVLGNSDRHLLNFFICDDRLVPIDHEYIGETTGDDLIAEYIAEPALLDEHFPAAIERMQQFDVGTLARSLLCDFPAEIVRVLCTHIARNLLKLNVNDWVPR